MKKTFSTLLSVISIANTAFGFIEPSLRNIGPESELRMQGPDSFYKPNQMLSILSNRPVAAKDKYGNRIYYSASGKMVLKVNTDGTTETSFNGETVKTNPDNTLVYYSKKIRGTNMVELKNDKGENIGYQEFAYGGKIVREYDKDKFVTKEHTYDAYAKQTNYSVDFLNNVTTVFNASGQPLYDKNMEGTQVAWYHYDNKGRLSSKDDISGNTTYFDKYGNMAYTTKQHEEGNVNSSVMVKYNYIKDDRGNYILDNSVEVNLADSQLDRITYYKNAKPQYTQMRNGTKVKEYTYDGQTLTNTYDYAVNPADSGKLLTTWTCYDIDGRPLAAFYNDTNAVDSSKQWQLAQEWVYSKGRLVGVWNESNHSLTAFVYQQKIGTYYLVGERPSTQAFGEFIQNLIDDNTLRKNYADKDGQDITEDINNLTKASSLRLK